MQKMNLTCFLCTLFVLTFASNCHGLIAAVDEVGKSEVNQTKDQWTDFWVVRLFFNIVGYASVIFPAWIVIKYIRSSGYLEKGGHGCVYSVIKSCVEGAEADVNLDAGGQSSAKPRIPRAITLLLCVAGLQGSYLTWGVLQERIMAHEYGKDDNNPGEKFKNSQFLVFMNRILALLTAFLIMTFTWQPRHTTPLYRYSYCSLSNIMSSWCQYEALKFVSFPTQVLAKASKIIPVMLMGKVVSNKTYEFYEYITAGMISVGVTIFLLSQGGESKGSAVTTASGVVILMGYMVFDSFTSNWQAELFSKHKMSSIQAMFGVNLFSCIFTSWSLIEQGGFLEASGFILKYSTFAYHVLLLSICSATGQLFIFYTISQFGAVIFTIIMTTRQGLAILLSCMIYGHPVSFLGFLGICIVFIALFLKIYAKSRMHKKPDTAASEPMIGPNKV
ncbi:adenosine 3'-phospho 5'-phosphosulfate transporter 1-like [Anneissia japonica]|uniref:adenosine 3'-phospho 5'-phosphosulfate transporter 1-like n=1 Tax=Anneissia japonica TaxID=1529436 RepID=UPI00142594E3|nr:adenosine 3'-phospho 5'-phosphosulfate transporter 1-like [Anneissia japonica]